MKYGEQVQVEYIDLADPGSQEEYSEVSKLAEERDLLYPLVAVNGHLRVAGSAHYYRILPLVEEALEVEPAAQADSVG
jgi:disulfide oxidoreductase YuzD